MYVLLAVGNLCQQFWRSDILTGNQTSRRSSCALSGFWRSDIPARTRTVPCPHLPPGDLISLPDISHAWVGTMSEIALRSTVDADKDDFVLLVNQTMETIIKNTAPNAAFEKVETYWGDS